jgi:hypothetical protein
LSSQSSGLASADVGIGLYVVLLGALVATVAAILDLLMHRGTIAES